MPRFDKECFCSFSYEEELTYEDVMTRESELLISIQQILVDLGAAHIDFTPINDTLQVRCAFAELDAAGIQTLCANLNQQAGRGVQGRILLVSKGLEEQIVGALTGDKSLISRVLTPEPRKAVRNLYAATLQKF